jgi:hypothetical protein
MAPPNNKRKKSLASQMGELGSLLARITGVSVRGDETEETTEDEEEFFEANSIQVVGNNGF